MNFKNLLGRKDNSFQAMWVGMGSLSSFALAIASAAILSRYFNKTDYGTYRQILYVYNTLLVIFAAGLPSVFSYFLPRHTLEQGKEIVWKITKVLFLLGGIFSTFLFVFSGVIATVLKNPELSLGLKVFSPIPMLLLPTLGIEGIFSTYKKTIYIAIYNTLSRLLMLFFIVMPVILFKGDYIFAIYGWLVVSVISLLIALRFKRIPFKGVDSEASSLSYKQIFTYSLPLVAASIWGIAIRSADQFYISRFFGTEVFAEFSNGFIDIPFVGMVTGATTTVLFPIFSKIVNDNDKNKINELLDLWRNALKKSAIIIYPIVIFFAFNAESIVIVLFSKTYIKSAIYFQIAMMLNFFNIIVFAPLLFALGENRFYARLHMFFALIAWIIGYAIILIFGSPIAIAVFSVLMSISKILISMNRISDIFKVDFWSLFPGRKFLLIIAHSVLVIGVLKILYYYFVPELNELLSLAITFTAYAMLLLGTSGIFKIDYFSVVKPFFAKANN